MKAFSDFKLRLRAFFMPGTVERELDDELAFHIECETRKLIADGSSDAEARHRALARFGAVPLTADQCRDERGISFFETLARDVSFALRTLRRTPLVALTVVSTIALGLGVVTVAFTFFNLFFFRVDARTESGRTVRCGTTDPSWFPRPRAVHLDGVRGDSPGNGCVHGRRGRPAEHSHTHQRAGGSRHVRLRQLLRHAWSQCSRGRTLTLADNENGGRAVVVLTQLGWEKLFAADPAVVGRELLVNGQPYAVVGVMPKDFRGLSQEPQDYWAPLALLDQFRPGESRTRTGWTLSDD